MKLLVGGCSFTQGMGFKLGPTDPELWPNVLAKQLNAEVTNVSSMGYDNPGIFLNTVSELTTNHYDLIIMQITTLNRISLSPYYWNTNKVSEYNVNPELINEKDYASFYKSFVKLNGNFEHWKRLVNVLVTVQNLVKQGYNIHLVNGLLDWTPEFFEKDDSDWSKSLIDFHSLPDVQIQEAWDIIRKQKEKIDLSLWINPFESMYATRIDHASMSSGHPGPISQKLFVEKIVKKLNL